MRTSCIPHPADEPLIMIRTWQVEACKGNLCAAALLNFFEYWHNMKIEQQQQAKELNDVAEKHGEPRHQNETLFQWHSTEELQAGILGLYGETIVQKSVKQLESLGFISIHKNPNPAYKWDKKNHYLYHPEQVISWLHQYRGIEREDADGNPVNTDAVEIRHRDRKTTASTTYKYGIDRGKTTAAIPEITSESSKDLPPESTNVLSSPTVEDEPLPQAPQTLCMPSGLMARFEPFWKAYPRKKGKGAVLKIWKRLKPDDVLLSKMLKALERQRASPDWTRERGKYIPFPRKWLNEERWDDEDEIPETTPPTSSDGLVRGGWG